MAFYNEQFMDELKSSNDIVDVVSEYVTLKRRGPSYKGLCPFHKEKTPSFSVSSDKQIFHCFGCGVGGDVVKFVMQIENVDFKEAVEILADRAKIELHEENESIDFEKVKLKERLYEINRESAKYFHQNLYSQDAEEAIKYLERRKLDNNTTKKFGVGFALGSRNDLKKHLESLGFTEEEMVLGGLVVKNDNGFADRFKQRIMFPIFDIKDRIIAFGGRVLDDSLPKYMNSPETPIYSKGKNIYALNIARKSRVTRFLMVEGYMDVISLHKNGIPNAVASLGTALTEQQGRLLKKYAQEIIIGYDSDGAGQAATIRGLDILSTIGCNVKVMKINDAKDPDEFVNKYGPDRLLKLMDNSMTLVEFKLKILKNEIDTSTIDGKIAYLNKATEVIAKIENSLEKEVYIKKIASEIGIGVEAIYAELNKKVYGKPLIKHRDREEIKERKSEESKEEIPENICNAEKMIIFFLCQNDKELFTLIRKNIDYSKFKVNLYRESAEILYRYYEGNLNKNIIDLFKEQEKINIITGIMQEEFDFGNNTERAVLDISKILKRFYLEEEKKVILKKLENRENDMEIKELEGRLNELIMGLHLISAGRRK